MAPYALLAFFNGSDVWKVVSHNWALISILSTILVLLIVPTLIVQKYVNICLNILRDNHPPMSMSQFGFIPIDGEDRSFHAADGLCLRGTIMRGHAYKPRGLIIFAPEFKSDRLSSARYCRLILEAGYDVFTFDFRGHGESACEPGYSPRQWPSDHEVSDVIGAVAFAEQWLAEQGRPIEIGLFGISRGGAAAILAAEGRPSIKALVCDGAFSSDCTIEYLMRRWASIFANPVLYEFYPSEFWPIMRWIILANARLKLKCTFPSVRKALIRMTPRPILFIHGERDSYIPVDQTRLLYAQSPQPRYLWIVANAKHNQSVDVQPEEYGRRIVQFFDRYLMRRPATDNMYNNGRFEELARSERAYHHVSVASDEADDFSPDDNGHATSEEAAIFSSMLTSEGGARRDNQ